MERIWSVVLVAGWVAYCVVAFFAYGDGIVEWFQLRTTLLVSAGISASFFILLFMRLTLLLVPPIFYGAWAAWGWAWWQAALLAAPSIAFMVAGILGVGAAALWEKLRGTA